MAFCVLIFFVNGKNIICFWILVSILFFFASIVGYLCWALFFCSVSLAFSCVFAFCVYFLSFFFGKLKNKYILLRILASIKFVSNCMFTCGGLCFFCFGVCVFLCFGCVCSYCSKNKSHSFLFGPVFVKAVLFFFFERVNEIQKTSRILVCQALLYMIYWATR
jgi:hypothetical protein